MINVIISFEVHPQSIEEVKELIQTFIAEIKKNEPETYTYRSFQDSESPTSFVHVMTFANEEAQLQHRNSAHCKAFVTALYPKCTKEPKAKSFYEIKN